MRQAGGNDHEDPAKHRMQSWLAQLGTAHQRHDRRSPSQVPVLRTDQARRHWSPSRRARQVADPHLSSRTSRPRTAARPLPTTRLPRELSSYVGANISLADPLLGHWVWSHPRRPSAQGHPPARPAAGAPTVEVPVGFPKSRRDRQRTHVSPAPRNRPSLVEPSTPSRCTVDTRTVSDAGQRRAVNMSAPRNGPLAISPFKHDRRSVHLRSPSSGDIEA
jgi:hypothetical protein